MPLSKSQLLQVLKSLIASSLAEQKKQTVDWALVQSWADDTYLDASSCGADSLDLVVLRTDIQLFFQVVNWPQLPELGYARKLGDLVDVLVEAQPNQLSLGFKTSGTTGAKKLVLHDLAELQQEAEFFTKHLSGIKRIVSLVPSHHLYGFIFTVLFGEQVPLDYLEGKGLTGLDLQRQLREGDLVVGFPGYWQLLAHSGIRFPQGVSLVSSTEACSEQLKNAMILAGASRFVEVYGSSETSGVGWRIWPEADYSLLPVWKQTTNGLIKSGCSDQRQHALMDKITWVDERHFQVGERLDGQIQVAGRNISLKTIEQTLLGCEGVKDIHVRKMLPEEGSGLKAFVVFSSGNSAETQQLTQLKAYAVQHLQSFQRPKHYTTGATLPKNAMGKLRDWCI